MPWVPVPWVLVSWVLVPWASVSNNKNSLEKAFPLWYNTHQVEGYHSSIRNRGPHNAEPKSKIPKGRKSRPSRSKSNIRQPESPPRRVGLPIHPGPVFRLPSPVFCPPSVLAYLTKPINHPAPFMQNKPNPQKPKTNTTSYATKIYINIQLRHTRKNKPKQTQSRYNQYAIRYTKQTQSRSQINPLGTRPWRANPPARPENRPCIRPRLIYLTQTDRNR